MSLSVSRFLMAVWLVTRSIRALRRQPVEKTAWFPVVMVLFMLAGLLHHFGRYDRAGWQRRHAQQYLHILAIPVVAKGPLACEMSCGSGLGAACFGGLPCTPSGFS